MGGMEVEAQSQAEARGGESVSQWTTDVLSISFIFSLLFLLTGKTRMKEIREPCYDP